MIFVSQHYCSIKINKWYKIKQIWFNKSVILLAKICSLLAQKALKHNFRFPDITVPQGSVGVKFNLRKSWLENDLKFQSKPNQHFLRGWFTCTFFHMIIWCRSNGLVWLEEKLAQNRLEVVVLVLREKINNRLLLLFEEIRYSFQSRWIMALGIFTSRRIFSYFSPRFQRIIVKYYPECWKSLFFSHSHAN